ncbi:hypothetical protein CBL_10305 [Carabus blaptoides fortunei]
MRFIISVIVLFGIVDAVQPATVTVNDDNSMPMYLHKEEDLSYSDLESSRAEKQRHYVYREYGTPSDVAHMHLPRGMTIGDLFGKNEKKVEGSSESSEVAFDPWSIVWYIGSFGGLIAFFLVVSCSEWCCMRNRAARAQQRQAQQAAGCPGGAARVRATARSASAETPPPAYHLFAPPPYDSITYSEKSEKFDVFVVPVHAVNPSFVTSSPVQTSPDASHELPPPEYTTVVIPPT